MQWLEAGQCVARQWRALQDCRLWDVQGECVSTIDSWNVLWYPWLHLSRGISLCNMRSHQNKAIYIISGICLHEYLIIYAACMSTAFNLLQHFGHAKQKIAMSLLQKMFVISTYFIVPRDFSFIGIFFFSQGSSGCTSFQHSLLHTIILWPTSNL